MSTKNLFPLIAMLQPDKGFNRRILSLHWLNFFLFCLVFSALSCKYEKLAPTEPNKQLLISNCDIGMAYDAESTTLIMPANPADVSQLSTLDKALMLPKRERLMESVCLMDDGTYTIESELMEPSNPIELPERTIGVGSKPAYKKMVNANGVISYYNSENEKINDEVVNDQSALALAVVQMFQELEDNPVQNDLKFTNYLDALTANGLAHTAQNGNKYTTLVTNPDGTLSVAVIDKVARMKVGQIDFDQEGHPCTLYMLMVTGQAPNVELKQMTQVIYFNAVESQMRMKMQKTTVFNSFSLQL
jgi:hypothetical protein